ncbi:MAG: alkaline phosphatase family protein [Promethearchaeia archaeon]
MLNNKMERVIVLALDGLSWNILEELISKQHLDNFKELIENGSYGILKAEDFLSSPKIFCSIFTGKKASKHGIRDFYSKEEDLTSKQIWDILHNRGYHIGVYRPLSIWSAKKFKGFCIPSPLLLEKESYPKNLNFISELDKAARSEKYSISFLVRFFWKLFRFHFPLKGLIKIIKRSLNLFFANGLEERMYLLKEIELIIHTNIYLILLRRYHLDFSVFFDYSFDTLGHIYWRDKDEKDKFSKVLPNAYILIDKFIGKIRDYASEYGYHLIICSDHGFERKQKNYRENYRTINVLNLLRELKLYYDVYGIYMTGSVVFRSRPNSTIPLKTFKESIESITCNGKKLFTIKPYENKLIVKINDFFGENRDFDVNLPNGKKLKLDNIIDFNPGHTGVHSDKFGVFLTQGRNIKKYNNIDVITPYDITPTILSLMGEVIPQDLDGRVLEEIFIKKSISS